MDLSKLVLSFLVFCLDAAVFAAKLSNSKLIPADGMLCGPGKMGFKFSRNELIERFKALSDNTKDPVEVVQIYVSGSKQDAICLYDPVLVEDRKSINAAIAEFEDGERGVNITSSPEIISLGNWLPYFTREKSESCVSSVKADTIVYFQAEVNIEVVSPLSQAGAKLRATIHCEMPRPQNVNVDLKVHRVDHIGSAVGEIPFSEFIQMKFVNPADPTLALTEVSLDDPVRMVLWKVRQEDRATLRTSIIPMHCELYGDNGKVSGISFVQNSCQARTPAEIITGVLSRKTDVDGMEFREVYWTDFKAFRFDGSTGLFASCVVRICSKTHLQDCQNRASTTGSLCFDEGGTQEMAEYPAITGESTEDGKAPEQPNQELELFRLAYPRKYVPNTSTHNVASRMRRALNSEDGEYVTIKQRLSILPYASKPANLQSLPNSPAAASADGVPLDSRRLIGVVSFSTEGEVGVLEWQKACSTSTRNSIYVTERRVKLNSSPKEISLQNSPSAPASATAGNLCFQSYLVYTLAAIACWLVVFAFCVIACLISFINRQRKTHLAEKECQGSVSSLESTRSYSDRQPIRFR